MPLHDKGRGAAPVEIDRLHRAQIPQEPSELVEVHAPADGLSAVHDDEKEPARFGDTHGGPGMDVWDAGAEKDLGVVGHGGRSRRNEHRPRPDRVLDPPGVRGRLGRQGRYGIGAVSRRAAPGEQRVVAARRLGHHRRSILTDAQRPPATG